MKWKKKLVGESNKLIYCLVLGFDYILLSLIDIKVDGF